MTDPTIVQLLAKVMGDVRAISKSERNKQQGFSFRGIDNALNAIGPAFRDHGIVPAPRVLSHQHRDFESKNGAVMHEAIVEMEYAFHGPAGDVFVTSALGEASDTSDKATSQAQSVAYRTVLLQMLAMPTDEADPDHHTVDRARVTDAPSGFDRDQVWADGVAVMNSLDIDAKDAVVKWGVKHNLSPSTLTEELAAEWATVIAAESKASAERQAAMAQPVNLDEGAYDDDGTEALDGSEPF